MCKYLVSVGFSSACFVLNLLFLRFLCDPFLLERGQAPGERVELRLALVCVLAEDLRPVLGTPEAFDLIYRE